MHPMPHSLVRVKRASLNFSLRNERIPVRCRRIISAPKNVGGDANIFEERPQVLRCDAVHGLPHHGACALVVVRADDAVEELACERLEVVEEDRDGEQRFAGFGEDHAHGAFDVLPAADARGGAEEEMIDRGKGLG